MKATTPATVDEYLAPLPEAQRAALDSLRQLIKLDVPDVVEAIGYGMPGYKYKGKHLITFGAWKNHLAIYGMNADIAEAFQADPKSYDVEGGTILLTADKPLPPKLVKRLLQARFDEIEAQAKRK